MVVFFCLLQLNSVKRTCPLKKLVGRHTVPFEMVPFLRRNLLVSGNSMVTLPETNSSQTSLRNESSSKLWIFQGGKFAKLISGFRFRKIRLKSILEIYPVIFFGEFHPKPCHEPASWFGVYPILAESGVPRSSSRSGKRKPGRLKTHSAWYQSRIYLKITGSYNSSNRMVVPTLGISTLNQSTPRDTPYICMVFVGYIIYIPFYVRAPFLGVFHG